MPEPGGENCLKSLLLCRIFDYTVTSLAEYKQVLEAEVYPRYGLRLRKQNRYRKVNK